MLQKVAKRAAHHARSWERATTYQPAQAHSSLCGVHVLQHACCTDEAVCTARQQTMQELARMSGWREELERAGQRWRNAPPTMSILSHECSSVSCSNMPISSLTCQQQQQQRTR
jgi:hypothetical protein